MLFLIALCWATNAQSVSRAEFHPDEEFLFSPFSLLYEADPAISIPREAEDVNVYVADLEMISQLANRQQASIRMVLPLTQEGSIEFVRLERVDYRNRISLQGVSADFATTAYEFDRGVHYYGVTESGADGKVALSVFSDRLIGVVFSPEGTFEIGPLKTDGEQRNLYVYYRSHGVHEAMPFTCSAEDVWSADDLNGLKPEALDHTDRSALSCRFITVYYECDFQMHNQLGGVQGVAQYVSALHHQMNMLYAKYNINLILNEINVWTEPDPYASIGSTGALLPVFVEQSLPFQSRLGHFLTTRSIGGGIAYLNTLCSPGLNKAVSGISLTFNDFPIYSWSTKVIAHEFGHNIGSPHTHNCFWNNMGTAIDGCGPQAGYNEGCNAPLPSNGGTIMSYCHLVSGVGVNFVEGFGDQPGFYLRDRIDLALSNPFCNVVSGLTFIDTVFYEACGLFQLDETTYTSSGTFLHVANPDAGCYDITLINLDIEEVNTVYDTICSGETYVVDTLSYSETGAYFIEFPEGELCNGTILMLEVVHMPDSIIVYGEDVFGVLEQNDAEYQWLDCNNGFEPIEGADYHLFLAFNEGSYALRIIRPGCTAITPCHEVVFSSTSPVIETINAYLAPNPGTGIFNLYMETQTASSTFELIVYNIQGKVVKQQTLNTEFQVSGYEINLSYLPAGYYRLQLKSAEANLSLPFIIIQ